jgi:two-component system LytT family response regulator
VSAPLRVLVADGDGASRRRAVRLLMDIGDLEIVGICASGAQTITAITRTDAQILLLDLMLSDGNAFSVIRAVGAQHMPFVIFTSAQTSSALRVFEDVGLICLSKPYNKARFTEAIETARATLPERTQGAQLTTVLGDAEEKMMPELSAAPGARRYIERVLIREGGQILFLKVSDIDWLEAAANYIRIHAGTSTHLIRDTMTAMEQKLPPDGFVRVHRSTIVNVDRIARMYQWFSGDYMVVLKDGAELRLSRHYRARLEAKMLIGTRAAERPTV